MICSQDYILKYVNGIPYLLPYGQMVADMRRALKLNETGVFLWNELSDARDIEDLFDRFCLHYEAENDERCLVKDDFHSFINTLAAAGLIGSENMTDMVQAEPAKAHMVNIAGLNIMLEGINDTLFDKFASFSVADTKLHKAKADMLISLCDSSMPRPYTSKGELIILNKELIISSTRDNYHMFFPGKPFIDEVILTKDGKKADIYCPLNSGFPLEEDLFHIIRHLFLYAASMKGLYACHSSSILYREKAWLFSAPSGTGKSTHTNLWKDIYNTPVINGDLNLIGYDNSSDSYMIYGTPWCGTSGIYTKNNYPLGGITILSKADRDICTTASPDKRTLSVSRRLINPVWTKELYLKELDFATGLTETIPVFYLECTKNSNAVRVMKSAIDSLFQDTVKYMNI